EIGQDSNRARPEAAPLQQRADVGRRARFGDQDEDAPAGLQRRGAKGARTRRLGGGRGCNRSSGRPTALPPATSSSGEPRRAVASDTDEGWGSTVTRSAPSNRTRVEPIPCSIESPLASTTITV